MVAANGGAMVFIGSASGLTASPRHAAYGAMKAALMQLVKTAAQELGPHGVRVNAVAPGPVWTERVVAEWLAYGPAGAENTTSAPGAIPLGPVS